MSWLTGETFNFQFKNKNVKQKRTKTYFDNKKNTFGNIFRRYVNESGKGTEASKLQAQNKYLEQKVEAYCQRLKDLVDIVSKSDLDILLMRYGVRDILDVPQQENGISNHVANINGSNTPDLGKML